MGYIVEALLGFALITAVNVMWFRANLGFVGVSPHPYWAVVLLLASRYGFLAGLFSGIVSAALAIGLSIIGRQGTTIYELWKLLLGEPVLFIAVGCTLGEISQTIKSRYEALLDEHEELKETFDKLRERYDAVVKAKQEVDTRILSQEQTLTTMHETAQALRSLSEGELYPAALDMVAKFLGAEASSIYLFEDGQLKLKAVHGELQNRTRPESLLPDDGLLGRAFTSTHVASANVLLEMYEKGVLPDGDALIAAPLLTSSRKVLGVLSIERLPFLKFNSQTIRMAEVFSGWCADALENALLYTDTKSKTITDDITGAYTINYMNARLLEECARARRYKTDLAMIILDILGYVDYSEEEQREILTQLSKALKTLLRNIDLLFSGDVPGRYIILMPNTPLVGAKVVGGKIVTMVGDLGGVVASVTGSLPVGMGVSAFDETNNTPELILAAALTDLDAKKGGETGLARA
ncbi:MAG: GAF domain-containing protein [Humidesulfovibrio sp.]|uniref:sensor domain-containing diguanylate cyclase n=1 Tax=Humidesulfovibrio sp. TaxID=2910988 RepID=UPI0027E83E65|nr:GAF domain-containing protein [Humidesulfovibrio sp.]MDQ7833783.1 GAF domain-containing protein [Humidesulfovibrio sp.]